RRSAQSVTPPTVPSVEDRRRARSRHVGDHDAPGLELVEVGAQRQVVQVVAYGRSYVYASTANRSTPRAASTRDGAHSVPEPGKSVSMASARRPAVPAGPGTRNGTAVDEHRRAVRSDADACLPPAAAAERIAAAHEPHPHAPHHRDGRV